MTSLKPHIVRAVYAWILENNLTPHILVNASIWGVQVPRQYVQDGKIILNIEPMAVREFSLSNDKITFQARFQGVSRTVSVPMGAVSAIFAAENGRGHLFAVEDPNEEQEGSGEPQWVNAVINNPDDKSKASTENIDNKEQQKPRLISLVPKAAPPTPVPSAVLTEETHIHSEKNETDDPDGDDDPTPKKKKGSWLRLIK
jgi:stringent starvation protein B